MDNVTETVKATPQESLGFFKYVFNFDEDNKCEMLNVLQYSALAIIPVLLILKAVKHLIDLVFVMLSDMEIDEANRDNSSIHELVKSMCADAGMRTSHKRPYTPFHMVYWNLRSTGGFPALSSHENVSMLSGFSPMLLNSFCTKGIEALKDADDRWHLGRIPSRTHRSSYCLCCSSR